MNELTVRLENGAAALPAVQWNHAEVEAWLEEHVGRYRGRAYNPEDIKDAKKDRAEVNRVEKELAAAQKRVQDAYRVPVDQFVAEMKRMRGIAREISAGIDEQVKRAEEAERDKRREELQKAYRENVGDELAQLITFERILSPDWLKKSMPASTARKELLVRLETIRAERENLREACGDDYAELERVYLESLDINAAFKGLRRLREMRKAQAMAEAERIAAETARAAAPVVIRPSEEQLQAREAGRQQAEANRCITADGKLDIAELRAQTKAATFTRTITITYTEEQGKAVASLLQAIRAAGVKIEMN